MYTDPQDSARPTVIRLEGEGLHYQKRRQDAKPFSRSCLAGIVALTIIGLLIALSLAIDYINFTGALRVPDESARA